jgi:excisionase family DNA binding protein
MWGYGCSKGSWMQHNDAGQAITRQTPVEELPEFLSPEEFRAYMGFGRSTVYELLRRDEIPHVKFGRSIRIPKTALQPAVADEVK